MDTITWILIVIFSIPVVFVVSLTAITLALKVEHWVYWRRLRKVYKNVSDGDWEAWMNGEIIECDKHN